ncbi:MAG: tyrosine--tRNA ligase, partial [Defluviitaleaceae bacterium]|nr:tyrosine--tRNA ligase [Defluviitaleaceae bacterium]
SYDFLKLFRDHNCKLQFGGNDQWSNIIGGVELIRRVEGEQVFGGTFTILTRSDGKKMGKSEKGAVWLDRNKTTPYEFYQYFRNISDADVITYLKRLTFLPIEEINELAKLEGKEINQAKEVLAYELTKIVHNEEDAINAKKAAQALFSGGDMGGSVPETAISKEEFENGLNIIELLEKAGLIPSRGEGRRLVAGGGVKINDVKIESHEHTVSLEDFVENGELMIQKGKKIYHRIKLT